MFVTRRSNTERKKKKKKKKNLNINFYHNFIKIKSS